MPRPQDRLGDLARRLSFIPRFGKLAIVGINPPGGWAATLRSSPLKWRRTPANLQPPAARDATMLDTNGQLPCLIRKVRATAAAISIRSERDGNAIGAKTRLDCIAARRGARELATYFANTSKPVP